METFISVDQSMYMLALDGRVPIGQYVDRGATSPVSGCPYFTNVNNDGGAYLGAMATDGA